MRARPALRPGAARPGGIDRPLLAGLAAIGALAAVLRVVHLGGNLPQLVAPDEPTVMVRAVDLVRGRGGPNEYDWPPAAMNLLAVTMEVLGHVGSYLLGRGLFVLVSLATIALTAALGWVLADDVPTARRLTAWAAAGLLAVSYLSVRLGRQVHPDHLQLVFVIGAFLALVRYDRTRRPGWIAAVGGLAGLAIATKYLGGLVGVTALVVAWQRGRIRHVALLAAGAVAGVVAGGPQMLTHGSEVLDGLRFQFGHQSGRGHLGYDGDGPSWWYHVTTSLPGNWGWPVALLAVAGAVWVCRKGTRAQRLAALHVGVTFAVFGASDVRFPHYVLLVLPFLASFASVAALRAAPRVRATPLAALAVLAIAVFPTVLDDWRLVRAAGATDTRTLATAAVAALPPATPVWTERYGALDHARATPYPDFGTHPEVLDCACIAVVSSYQEDRYRREPERYRAEVAVYDALRRRGRALQVIRPAGGHLRYDWDVLPGNGMGRLPLTGEVGPVGPTITLLDLR